MNIRMVLLASAAAFAASTPVLAADAIVAAEPEPVEYVRVCDAYGTGYFYIPGTETCLKIEGYIRFQVNVGEDVGGDSDWDAVTRGQVQFTAKSDTEYGPLTGDVDPVTGLLVPNDGPNNVGVAFGIGGTAGAFSYQVTGGWDVDNEDGAVRAMGTVDIGPGTLGLAAVYSSGPNSYYSTAEWAVAAEYAIKATDKLKITPGVQYYGNYIGGASAFDTVPSDYDGAGDAWKVGLTVDYQIVDNFYAKASVQYLDPDDGDDSTTGYFRLQRSF
ncbi:porin [Rhizobium leguminosarum bv. viciae]|uniref:porin n=1 Tax=Rhizobium leguminosarum TaxID=384 RepID=UPI001440E655|nr:porin [Rhizobium leguminosarum]NKK00518.1 porin [Rhizobium leguminosarum bv. viciae]